MAFSSIGRFIYGEQAQPNYQHLQSLRDLVVSAHNDEELRDHVINIQFIRDYCRANKIPYIEEFNPFVSVQQVAMDRLQEKPKDNPDVAAAAGLYYLEVLDGLDHFKHALKIKSKMKLFNPNTDYGKKAIADLKKVYSYYLDGARGKGNFLAMFLYLYECLSTEMADKSPELCMSEFRTMEKVQFSWLETFHTVAQLYLAELYYCFASTLSKKIALYKQYTIASINAPAEITRQQTLIIEAHALIAECILKARAAINQFDENKKEHITEFTQSSMLNFRENMTGFNPDDTIMKLRTQLNEIERLNNMGIRPIPKFDFLMSAGFFGVNVDKDKTPWEGDRSQPVHVELPINKEPTVARVEPPPPPPPPPPGSLPPVPAKAVKEPVQAGPAPAVQQEQRPPAQVPAQHPAPKSPANEKEDLQSELHAAILKRAYSLRPVQKPEPEIKPLPISDDGSRPGPSQLRNQIQQSLGKYLRGGEDSAPPPPKMHGQRTPRPQPQLPKRNSPPPPPPRENPQQQAVPMRMPPPPPPRKWSLNPAVPEKAEEAAKKPMSMKERAEELSRMLQKKM